MKAILLSLLACTGAALAGEVSFNRQIRPLLSESCFHCHGPSEKGRKAGLRLDLQESAFEDRDGAPAIIPGKPEMSELIRRVASSDPDDMMPPPESRKPRLEPDQVALLRDWIREGAGYERHWSFVPLKGTGPGPLRHYIDREIRRHLQLNGLNPSRPALRETLIRRLSLDLRGLPPTIEEVEAFLSDTSETAWERLVDRFLASPECAERLALEWLDVARYSDTNGYSIDDHRDMWGWRDWVIHAFMRNQPYDDFIVEQLAGDLLPDATPEQKMATGFLRNSMNTHEGGTIPEEYRVAYIADKIDTVSSAFMGLTLKCAQCHDHKYDPVSQKDYYRFFAFFNNASENGTGAVNGNTKPVIQVRSPLQNEASYQNGIQKRIQRLSHLKSNLVELEPNRFDQWKSGVLAKARAIPARPANAVFSFPKGHPQPHWLWAEKQGAVDHVLFRKTLELKRKPVAAQLFFTCDDVADLYINRKKAGSVEPWMEPKTLVVTDHLVEGSNRIGVDARNKGSLAGFIAVLQLHYPDGVSDYVVTDSSWHWRKPADDETIPDAFEQAGAWQEPFSLGKYGVKPWGKLKGAQPAGDSVLDLARLLQKTDRSPEEDQAIASAYASQASRLTQRFDKALSIELGVLEKQLKGSKASVMIMDSGKPRKNRVLMRGQYDQPGEEVSPGVPAMFSPLPTNAPADRLALARWLVDDAHPLTARVTVNRYWQMIFGTGLVKTAEDFGAQGEWPTHPDLLDGLAIGFRESGWNLRQLLKEIVMSQTYLQRSDVPASRSDPYNRWLARAPRQRLSAELVRDNALSIGGILHHQLGGPSVYPPQPGGLWRQVSHFGYGAFTAQAYFPGDKDHQVRRSMYTFWKRTAPPPGMAIFDAPTRETCTIRRLVTNTPLQALVLMNDPQFLDAARALARRIMTEGGSHLDDRIRYAFRLATARFPTQQELQILTTGFEREHDRFVADPRAAADLLQRETDAGSHAEVAAYTMVASTILNLNETITKQ